MDLPNEIILIIVSFLEREDTLNFISLNKKHVSVDYWFEEKGNQPKLEFRKTYPSALRIDDNDQIWNLRTTISMYADYFLFVNTKKYFGKLVLNCQYYDKEIIITNDHNVENLKIEYLENSRITIESKNINTLTFSNCEKSEIIIKVISLINLSFGLNCKLLSVFGIETNKNINLVDKLYYGTIYPDNIVFNSVYYYDEYVISDYKIVKSNEYVFGGVFEGNADFLINNLGNKLRFHLLCPESTYRQNNHNQYLDSNETYYNNLCLYIGNESKKTN